MSDRDLYARVGVAQIPHILSMVDRNLLSPTYGCFDRSYWHYKTSSFPSGMYQEFVLPLALAFLHPLPGGEQFYNQSRLRELVVAGIRYAAVSSHRDGSCDDYFPYERALGAAAFSLYACTEGYLLLGLSGEDLVAFFRKRGGWLMERQEAGRLSNHHALVVLALYNVYLITGDATYLHGARRRLQMLLSWQSEEGWFPEYEGCDPGYLTATIDFLAKYLRKSNDETVIEPLKAAVLFARQFMHPDGSFGGEYGSRNTCIFFPHGFELMGDFLPEAIETAELYLMGVSRGRQVHLEDDRMCAHLAYDHIQAYLDFHRRPSERPASRGSLGRRYWQTAQIYVHSAGDRHAVISAAKGGVIRLYVAGELAYGDSGIIARLSDGTTLVSHRMGGHEVILLEDGIQVAGRFSRCRFRLPTPLKQVIFHMGMLTVGRWGSDLVRLLLQRVLIVGDLKDPMRFRRTFHMGPPSIMVDEIWTGGGARDARKVTQLYAGTDHTSIYVAMSNSFQSACLLPWTDYGEHLEELNRNGYVRIERRIG